MSNPREQFNQQHIRTSIDIPLEDQDVTETVARVAGDRYRGVVAHCASAHCDTPPKAAKKLDNAGFSNAFDYEGGTENSLKHH
jgi:rhodanese-related sulfurtransferase